MTKNKSGIIGVLDLKDILMIELDQHVSGELAQLVFDIIDFNANNELDYDEFILCVYIFEKRYINDLILIYKKLHLD